MTAYESCCSGKGKGKGSVCGQVWWPILGICPLHLTHPSAHSQQWTHTRSSGQPCCGARGAVGGSVPCSRVSPRSWYWRWREHLLFTPPTDNPCRTWESNLQPLGYKSNSLTIRPRLPREEKRQRIIVKVISCLCMSHCVLHIELSVQIKLQCSWVTYKTPSWTETSTVCCFCFTYKILKHCFFFLDEFESFWL